MRDVGVLDPRNANSAGHEPCIVLPGCPQCAMGILWESLLSFSRSEIHSSEENHECLTSIYVNVDEWNGVIRRSVDRKSEKLLLFKTEEAKLWAVAVSCTFALRTGDPTPDVGSR